ncbi:hypothetical protein [Tenacibaculum caenipelagi]|uniref:Uncharacterized protein n=1 Tax=Tenacibaculum caenipelagi TaxID=1325435 RepID=A0A4R6TE37_9FLAO|nr:hypothetical protein [Tenacibaculum caenipelagi]TDQ27633.1 hypothetical protein DFQ07_1484 [Tenacibaculum caenipelagi]
MANYAASVLAEAKLILAERFAAPEKRLKSAGVFGAFRKNTNLSLPNIGELRTKEERPEKGYFFNRSKRSTTNSRTHNHTGAVGDSSEVAFNWQTFTDNAQTSLKRADNNIFEEAQILANEFENMFKNIHEDADAASQAFLATNKSLVNTATKNGGWNDTNKVFEITAANKDRFFQYGKSMLRQNHYKGMADVILDPILYAQAEYLASQGQSNATNFGFQFGGLNHFEAVDLADANYGNGISFFIPEATIGVVDWIPKQNRQGKGDYESALGGYGSIVDPFTGLTYAVHAYADRADTSASGGDTQDVVINWELSVDLSFNKAELSTANESTIFEVGQL